MTGVPVEVRDLVVQREGDGDAPILDGVSLSVPAGSRYALIGPSGSGKSTLLRAILGLVPVRSGTVRVGDVEVRSGDGASRRRLSRSVAWIPQDAVGSLDPRMDARSLVAEALILAKRARRAAAAERAGEWLSGVGLARDAFDRRPGELSGGQAQRVVIARALATEPGLVLADEPTSALDPLVQARVLCLLSDRCAEAGATLLLVAHAPGVVRRFCDRVSVLHEGRIVETGPVPGTLDGPRQAVTRSLVDAELRLPGG